MSTETDLLAEIEAGLPTNTTYSVRAVNVRAVLEDMVSRILADVTAAAATGGAGNILEGFTHQQVVTTNFPSPPPFICTVGYYDPDDYGGALYEKVTSFTTPICSPLVDAGRNYNVGTFSTLDGAKYQMIPTSNDVYVNAFGAKKTNQNDFSFDNWQAFEDCKYWILGLPDPNNAIGMNLTIPHGNFYLSRPHSMEGGPYNIIGVPGGTLLRFHERCDGIQIQHSFGSSQTVDHDGGPANTGFTLPVGMTVYWPGSTHLYVCRIPGVPSGTAPTSTGTGIVNGGCTLDYVRELTWSETRGQTSGALISGVALWSRWDWRNQPAPFDEDHSFGNFAAGQGGAYHSGIVMRNRITCRDVNCASFPGHGHAIVADGDPEVRGSGNVNQWRLDRCNGYYNGHDAFHIGLADANAGVAIDLDMAYNHRWGVADWSFFGNRLLSLQSNQDGRKFIGNAYPGACLHNGYWWIARVPNVGIDSVGPDYTHEPGTDRISWIRVLGAADASPNEDTPVWDPSIRFVPCGPYSNNNNQAATQWYGVYVESGSNPPQYGSAAHVLGGIGAGTPTHGSDQMLISSGFKNQVPIKSYFSGADGGANFDTAFGPAWKDGGTELVADTTIWNVSGGGSNIYLGGAQHTGTLPTVTASISDTTINSAAFHGQIGVGDGVGDNAWANILFVTSVESGAIVAGQTISGAGIPSGSLIGGGSWWLNSYVIVTGNGSTIGGTSSFPPVGTSPGITNEAMTSATVSPLMTVTASQPNAISLGATVTGTGVPSGAGTKLLQFARQVDPTTHANISFTGGPGTYVLSYGGLNLSSRSFDIQQNMTKNLDFALSTFEDQGTHIWGWTGRTSTRLFGRTSDYPRNKLWATGMILGGGTRGMDDGWGRVVEYCDGPPSNAGDFKTGEFRFERFPAAGRYPAYQYCGTDTGLAGTPKWVGVGVAY
jgi:hypothetical protein